MELMLADLESLERREANLAKKAKGGDKESAALQNLIQKVLPVLQEFKLNQSQYTTEKNVENNIANFLGNFFNVHRQYNIGGYLALKIDIDLEELLTFLSQ